MKRTVTVDSEGLGISNDGGVTFANYPADNGLGSNAVFGVYADDDRVYAATAKGLSVGTCTG